MGCKRQVLGCSLVVAVSALATAQEPAGRSGVPVAQVSFADKDVQRGDGSGRWSPVRDGERMRTGERLRTGDNGVARIEFPWMTLSLGPSSVLAIPEAAVLSMILEEGRMEILSEGDIIKLYAGDAEIRGQGRAVVRLRPEATVVAAQEGRFRVKSADQTISLKTGEGTLVAAGEAPTPPEPLPEPPSKVRPGSDPRYVKQGDPVELSWQPSQGRYHVQILGITSDVILVERDVESSPQRFSIPWLGTFRWRVSLQDERGFEGVPSAEGLVCIVEK